MVKKMTDWSVLEPFLNAPAQELHLALLAQKRREPHTTLRLKLAPFVEEGVLKTRKAGNMTLFRLNKEHPNLIEHLVIAEKLKLLAACRTEPLLREFSRFLREKTADGTIAILFGSATTKAKTAHDFDLLVIGEPPVFTEFSERYRKEVHLINVKRTDRITSALKQEILKNHLLLTGSEDAMRWLLW